MAVEIQGKITTYVEEMSAPRTFNDTDFAKASAGII